jgi:hypothetical protein
MKRSLLLLLLLAPLGACASAQAKTPVESPKLEVPPPPPRLIETVTPSEPPPLDPVAELPANPATPRPRPSTPKTDTAKPEPPKTEPPAEQPPATAPAPVPPPLPQLRTPSSPDAARQVQEIIDRANGALKSIDYQALSNDQKAQYDNAKLLIKQAEDAVKAANFDFAKNVAEKAERIAKELHGR